MGVIGSLQVFRGLAVVAVVVHQTVASAKVFVETVLCLSGEAMLDKGFLGADFFFALSGFIIMYAHMGYDRSAMAVREVRSEFMLQAWLENQQRLN